MSLQTNEKEDLLELGLERLERLASGTWWNRFIAHPGRYIWAQLYRRLLYSLRGAQHQRVYTFFQEEMNILLPSSTDIYLTGGKSHPSEIRLARFLLKELNTGDHLADVGAHYGYFSLLAAHRVGPTGRVWAFEAAPKTYAILQQNANSRPVIQTFALALAAKAGQVTFYEFPNRYAEFNSLDREQYETSDWYNENAAEAVEVLAQPLDAIIAAEGRQPDVVKIDVEGAEYDVLSGGHVFFSTASPTIVMEYLLQDGGGSSHRKALKQLEDWGYKAHLLDDKGELVACADVEGAMQKTHRKSDNVVCIKP